MYPALREDHLRYLQKWGFIRPAFRNNADTFYGFSDLTLIRQVHNELQRDVPFRGVLRDLQATRSGQLTFDFRIDAHPARILALKPRDSTASATAVDRNRPLSGAEQYFMMGSLLDDGSPEHQEEAAQAYRRALETDPDLVAAIINLANIRYAKDELAEAQALYERAICSTPPTSKRTSTWATSITIMDATVRPNAVTARPSRSIWSIRMRTSIWQ